MVAQETKKLRILSKFSHSKMPKILNKFDNISKCIKIFYNNLIMKNKIVMKTLDDKFSVFKEYLQLLCCKGVFLGPPKYLKKSFLAFWGALKITLNSKKVS